jgi:excinuclease UvrABC helicase subunit UvrB
VIQVTGNKKYKTMVHPKIDLDKITSDLEAIGFAAITRLQFRQGSVDVRVVNGLIPEGLDFVPEVFFSITIYSADNEVRCVWNCPIDSFRIDDE